MLRGSTLLLVFSCPVLATDFVPIEVGNRWVYIHKNFNGQHIGSYRSDTCFVEITAERFETHAGQRYFSGGLGSPCGRDEEANLRKDERGDIVMRLPEPVAGPDTTSFIETFPEFAAPFREYLTRWPSREDEILYLDFNLDAGTIDPFLERLVIWHVDYVDSVVGHFARRIGDGTKFFPSGSERTLPPPFVPGAARAAISFDSLTLVHHFSGASLLEDGIGLVAEYDESRESISGHSTTILLWARVGGVEYGERPTAVNGNTWAEVKRDAN